MPQREGVREDYGRGRHAVTNGGGRGNSAPLSLSRKFFDYNPQTGLLTTTAFEDGRNIVKYEQDCSPLFEDNAKKRADTDRTAKGIKDSLMHAAFVPDVVIIDMLTKHGVNFYDNHQTDRVMQLLETEYSHCKTTHKRLWIPR